MVPIRYTAERLYNAAVSIQKLTTQLDASGAQEVVTTWYDPTDKATPWKPTQPSTLIPLARSGGFWGRLFSVDVPIPGPATNEIWAVFVHDLDEGSQIVAPPIEVKPDQAPIPPFPWTVTLTPVAR